MNKYEEIANALEDAFNAQELQTRIIVGTTDNIKWEDVVTDDTTTFCVLLPTGGNTVKTNAGLLQTEFLSLYMALPNDQPQQYTETLSKVCSAISSFIQAPLEVGTETYLFNDNGLAQNDFRVVKGHHIGVVTQSIVVGTAGNLLDVAGAVVTFYQPTASSNAGSGSSSSGSSSSEGEGENNGGSSDDSNIGDNTSIGTSGTTLLGLYHYTYGRVKNYDPNDIHGSTLQQNAFRSEAYSLVVEYYKIKENTLHRLLSHLNDNYLEVTVYDGDEQLCYKQKMNLTSYTQDGVIGGYTNVKVTFVTGVME